MKKSNRFLLIACLFCALIICNSTIALSAQQVKIPYVVSGYGGWWTGIAITNESDNSIDDMTLYFTTDEGASGRNVIRLGVDPIIPGPIKPNPIIPGPIKPVPLWLAYKASVPEISKHSILAKTLADLYGANATLPSQRGSIVLSHTGSEKFSVTLYIGNPTGGFGFQVFKSTAP